jgi:hypothetical protein
MKARQRGADGFQVHSGTHAQKPYAVVPFLEDP